MKIRPVRTELFHTDRQTDRWTDRPYEANSRFLQNRDKRLKWALKQMCFKVGRITLLGTAVAQWLRCCATNRKVAGSLPDWCLWIALCPWGRQHLTEMSTRRISWV